ncbi:MAG: hypothetical protein H8E29_00255 [Anaerolineales bacterium]|uniref:Uncharacterized protein n=1 Tax=Candidatus Desulfolinea nitratireducens TaxID=2841698 RepID=A0A8J6TDQ9_9CHLR|nr:hypothetical protein [Candidatus Desulfolinea nitratireducens]
MKKTTILLVVIMIVLSACAAPSEKKCGDGVCDGPENGKNCPEDCTLSQGAGGESSDAQEGTESQDEAEADARDEGQTDDVFAEVYVEIAVTRDEGVGDCGVEPWGVDHIDGGDFTCPPPKYWFGYDLEATAMQQVNLIPQGEGWVFTPRTKGGGTYQQASAWSDGQRVCEPKSMQAKPFGFQVEGAAAGGEITMTFTSNPVEIATWECDSGTTYERETTLLRIDWGAALGGDYHDLSVFLSAADHVGDSKYRKTYSADMNPSPDERDHAQVSLTFTCMQQRDAATSVETACPW